MFGERGFNFFDRIINNRTATIFVLDMPRLYLTNVPRIHLNTLINVLVV